MSVTIQPESVVLTSGEVQRFFADKPQMEWSLSPQRGRISNDGEYKAPMLIFNSRIVEVTARNRANPLETGIAVIALSSAPFWMSVLAGLWALLFPALLIALFLVWPPPVQPVSVAVEVDPPAVTLAPKQMQQFFATVPNALDQEVIWSASNGTITPTGLYTPPADATAGHSAVITATRSADHSQSGSAMVLFGDTSFFIIPSRVDLKASETVKFEARGAGKVNWSAFPGVGSSSQATPKATGQPSAVKDDGTYTAPAGIQARRKITVTAVDASTAARLASATVSLLPDSEVPSDGLKFAWFLVTREKLYLALVLIMGALGSYLAASRSFVNYVGSRQFAPSWGLFYFFRPSFCAGLALLVFFGYRIGAIVSPGGGSPADPAAAAFIAGIVGLFADLALEKLKEVVETLFRAKDNRTDKMNGAGTSATSAAVAKTAAAGAAADATAATNEAAKEQ